MPDALPLLPKDEAELERQLQRANLTGDPLGYATAMNVRAVWENKAVAAQCREPMPPEAMERAARAIAQRAGQMLVQVRWWAVVSAVGPALCVSLGVGYGVGRYELLGEVTRVEIGLAQAVSLPVGAQLVEIARNNPDGLVFGNRRRENGRRAGTTDLWLEPPGAPMQQARR